MIDYNADIISYKSIGNILIADNVFIHLPDFYKNNIVRESSYHLPNGEERRTYYVDEILTISTLLNSEIVSLACNEKYQGKYKNKLYAGITMQMLINLTSSQRILNGEIIIDKDYGISFVLPSPYDEIADYIDHIPLDLRLNKIYVSDNTLLMSGNV